jgi:hypothetical protein
MYIQHVQGLCPSLILQGLSNQQLLITTLHLPNRKHRLQHGVFSDSLFRNGSSSIVSYTFFSSGTCLPSRCLAMNYSGFQASCYICIRNAGRIRDISLGTATKLQVGRPEFNSRQRQEIFLFIAPRPTLRPSSGYRELFIIPWVKRARYKADN